MNVWCSRLTSVSDSPNKADLLYVLRSYSLGQREFCPFYEVIQSLLSLTCVSSPSRQRFRHYVFWLLWRDMWPKQATSVCETWRSPALFGQHYRALHLSFRYVIRVRNFYWIPVELHFKCIDVFFNSFSPTLFLTVAKLVYYIPKRSGPYWSNPPF